MVRNNIKEASLMKTRITKILALMLAMLMVLSAFVGCGKTETPDTPSADNTPSGDNDKPEENKYPDAGKIVITDTFYPKYPEVGEYDEMKARLKKWFDESLENGNLFSATVDGQKFDDIFPRFVKDVKRETNADGDELITATFTDEASHLKFTVEAVLYGHNPSLDYVIYLTNTSKTENTPIISELNPLDSEFEMKANAGFTIHTNEGSHENIDDFKPIVDKITKAESSKRYNVTGGTSSNAKGFPFFDVIGKDEGIIMAIGWSGQWESDFKWLSNNEFNMKARQQNFNALLFPEETIRTPRIVMTYFTGDEEYGHNIWRRLVISDYTPPSSDPEGFKAPLCVSTWGRTAAGIKKYLAYYKDSPAELFWIDAGWYSQGHPASDQYGTALGTTEPHVWHHFLGDWSQSKILYPNGLKEVSDFVHKETDMRFMLWWMIEDARGPIVNDWTFDKKHYILARNADGSLGYASALDLSSDETTDMLIDYFSHYIEDEGLDCVRVDKSTTLDWHYSEKDRIVCKEAGLPEGSRAGISEAKYVANLYRVWDTLYEKYPQFMLDNCSSGGRRIDIEMTKRGIPLWRTDYTASLEATQAMTQYLAKWIPLNCIGNLTVNDEYANRSKYSATNIASLTSDLDAVEKLIKWLEEFEMLRPYWYGDYYQLLPEDRETTTWQAYQLYREDWQEGMFVAIRRGDSPLLKQTIKLEGLMPDREYTLHNIDDEGTENDIVKTGKELMEKGIDISINQLEIDCYIISLNRIDTDVIR